MSRVKQSGLQSRFVELSHYFSVNSSLVKNFGAVVLDDPDRLTAILQLPPPPCLSDECLSPGVGAVAELLVSVAGPELAWMQGSDASSRFPVVTARFRHRTARVETLRKTQSVGHFRWTLVDPECVCFVICCGSPNR